MRSEGGGAVPSASYAAAQQEQSLDALVQRDVGPDVYAVGNNRSQTWQLRMDRTYNETEKLRQQCRVAAGQSSARGLEEKVDLAGLKRSIHSARGISAFAGSLIVKSGRRLAVGDKVMVLSKTCIGTVCRIDPHARKPYFVQVGAAELPFGFPKQDVQSGMLVVGMEHVCPTSSTQHVSAFARSLVQREGSKFKQPDVGDQVTVEAKSCIGTIVGIDEGKRSLYRVSVGDDVLLPHRLHLEELQLLKDEQERPVHERLPLEAGQPSPKNLPEGAQLWLGHLLRPATEQHRQLEAATSAETADACAAAEQAALDSPPSHTAEAKQFSPQQGPSPKGKDSAPELFRRPSKEGAWQGPAGALRRPSKERYSLASSEGLSVDEFSEGSIDDDWPPKKPTMRFRNRMHFAGRFKPAENLQHFKENNMAIQESTLYGTEELSDAILGWTNHTFALKVKTRGHFELGFPIIILTMLDAIYPKRVRWGEVDWRLQYKRAITKNYQVCEKVWAEVSMEKARDFRNENTHLRLENMITASLQEKLDFMKLMKRWFDQRIHYADPFHPMEKRREFVSTCHKWGREVRFPPWMPFEEECELVSADGPQLSQEHLAYLKLPEYKRLIFFLGSPEHQTM